VTLKKVEESIIAGDSEGAKKVAEDALSSGLKPGEIATAAIKGINEVGERFGKMEVFLTDLVFASKAMKTVMKTIELKLAAERVSEFKKGKVVLGTVMGDIHDIGKNLVGTLLTAAGFDVYDLGVEVPAKRFIEKAEEVDADIIASSSLMSTTRPYQRELVRLLKDMGLRENYKVMVGGGAVRSEWAEEIGADGHAEDAYEAVKVAKRLLGGDN